MVLDIGFTLCVSSQPRDSKNQSMKRNKLFEKKNREMKPYKTLLNSGRNDLTRKNFSKRFLLGVLSFGEGPTQGK